MKARGGSPRLLAVSAVVLAMVIAGCSSNEDSTGDDSQGATPTVRMALLPGIVTNVPARLGVEQGIFQAAGVSVDISVAPTTVTADTLLGSETDVIAAAPSTIILARQAGRELSFICGGFEYSPVALIAPIDSSLAAVSSTNNWEDVLRSLKGLTIGIPVPLGSGPAKLLEGTLRTVGVDSGQYTLVNVGVGPAAQAAIANGQVDVALMVTPDSERVLAQGKGKQLLFMPDGPQQYKTFGSGWVTTTEWAEANPETAAKLCQGLSDSYAWMTDTSNQVAVDAMITTTIGELPQEGVDLVRDTLTLWKAEIPEAEFNSTIKTFVELGVVPATPAEDYASMVIQPKLPVSAS